jgi:RIO-like serine/threonine protein kinase
VKQAESVAADPVTLKQDLFGTVTRIERDGALRVVRDCSTARWWLRGFARHLLGRERRALMRLADVERVPRLLASQRSTLEREWIDGQPMQVAQPRDPLYFREALRLVRRLHARDVTHDDLAKEPNWLVTPEGLPAVVDFQLASHAPARAAGAALTAVARVARHREARLPLRHAASPRVGRPRGRRRSAARPLIVPDRSRSFQIVSARDHR